MKRMRFLDGFVQVVKAADPEKWGRYCKLVSKVAHVSPETEAESDEVGRKKLAGHVKETRDEAVRGDFRDVFSEVYKLESAFPDLFVEAMRSKRISVTALDPDNLPDPINITPEMMDIVLDTMRAPFIVGPDLGDAKLDWHASAIDVGHRTFVGVRVTMKKAAHSKRGGRPPVLDWDAIEAAVHVEIGKRGKPSSENVKGWQTNADVCRFVADLLEARKEHAADSTIKERVNAMLKRFEMTET